ncbi:hypothetical protein CXB51_012640 [Gossypium anomalum]|uniref:RNase H type-1 domain-containing protein n=1 Tax=Gossypium anomalum TaxID=47600 RepID=A0A8J6D2X0_9ROSI|nr:hypothetical protein CXB51_012640 [Gossypium anomalum]
MLKEYEEVWALTLLAIGRHRIDFVPDSLDDWVFLNTDGSVNYENMFAAAGGLLRDQKGAWIVGYTRYLGICEVIVSELWGILHGLQIALDRGFRKVTIRTDNLEVVNLIQEGVCKGSNSSLIMRILMLLKQLNHWNLQNIPREENGLVDKIVNLRRDRMASKQPMIFIGRVMKKIRRREEEPSYEGGGSKSVGVGTSKSFSFRDAILNLRSLNNPVEVDWGVDDLELREDDVRKDIADGVPFIEFSNRIDTLIEESMSTTVVVKLLGSRIGYNALWNKLCALWKPMIRFQLMDIDNYYYLAKFESKLDYNNALSNGPWVVFGHYLTVQPCPIGFVKTIAPLICTRDRDRIRGITGHMYEALPDTYTVIHSKQAEHKPVSLTRPRHACVIACVQQPGHSVYDVIMHLGAHGEDTRPYARPCPPHG